MHIAGPGINLGLERIERLLQGWGNPHKRLKAVHVTGTNGKGSTSLIIATVLQKAGYKVGSFTSPHLHSYRERITINGEPIPGEVLLAYLRRIKVIAEAMERGGLERPTEFEVLTAVAFRYFADQGVEVGILE
ncbi:MAG: bifunctional folylpolyglutamate synthase/dihydrofolate synthase, partial [Syntrophomonadaceae bacterium]|nr:bifunctional folylpolyglutamate synthase/dihydrofolate synthase [Syntrophomonadaceae bacterium]